MKNPEVGNDMWFYQEGYESYNAFSSVEQNPYSVGTQEYEEWRSGYLFAETFSSKPFGFIQV